MLDGKMSFISEPDTGTEYFFEIPLNGKYEKNSPHSNSR